MPPASEPTVPNPRSTLPLSCPPSVGTRVVRSCQSNHTSASSYPMYMPETVDCATPYLSPTVLSTNATIPASAAANPAEQDVAGGRL